MSRYCTNCGVESSKKICTSCGVKRNATHNFCAFCGAELPEKAAICTNCKEAVKAEHAIWNILNLICAIPILVLLRMAVGEGQPSLVIFSFLLSFLLCLPLAKLFIHKLTLGKMGLRSVLKATRNVAVIALLCVGMANITSQREVTVYKEEATAVAEMVFHEEVHLKNESSYVLNDSKVTWETTPYNNIEGSPLRLVWVTLDYSAQNGFGGMTRDTYTVELLFDTTKGTYKRLIR